MLVVPRNVRQCIIKQIMCEQVEEIQAAFATEFAESWIKHKLAIDTSELAPVRAPLFYLSVYSIRHTTQWTHAQFQYSNSVRCNCSESTHVRDGFMDGWMDWCI